MKKILSAILAASIMLGTSSLRVKASPLHLLGGIGCKSEECKAWFSDGGWIILPILGECVLVVGTVVGMKYCYSNRLLCFKNR